MRKPCETEVEEETEDDAVAKYDFIKQKRWNTRLACFNQFSRCMIYYIFQYSKHPYLFFNQDHTTMTFLGFSILPNGDLIDHETNEIIERDLMS